jgi:hypothetical protein
VEIGTDMISLFLESGEYEGAEVACCSLRCSGVFRRGCCSGFGFNYRGLGGSDLIIFESKREEEFFGKVKDCVMLAHVNRCSYIQRTVKRLLEEIGLVLRFLSHGEFLAKSGYVNVCLEERES